VTSGTYTWLLLGIATAAAAAGIFASVVYSATRRRIQITVPLSAGLLLGVALFGLLPELAGELSWALTLALFAAGCLSLTLIDRFFLKICPDCAHDHDHHDCEAPLHGFATPVLIAAGLHALLDGWMLTASSLSTRPSVRVTLPLALVLHKLPEGLALGGILKSAMKNRMYAFGLACLAEAMTLAGGAVAIHLAPRLGSAWTGYPLAVAGGFFLFLAGHALWAEWKRSPRFALAVSLAGFAFSGLLQAGLRSYFGV
jgi:zinc transporter ZupT